MHQITFMIGLGLEPSVLAMESLKSRMDKADKLLLDKFGGYTVFSAMGGWVAPMPGESVSEPTMVIVVLANDVSRGYLGEVAGKLRDLFNQQCVAVSVVEATVMYV